MNTEDLYQEGFYFPLFTEISFMAAPLAIHPVFTLDMFKAGPVQTDTDDKKTLSQTYSIQLFEKLLSIPTYDFHYLMTYHLENIVNKREWLEKYMMLISNNKERFINRRGVDEYIFLFELVDRHLNAFNDAFLSPLSNSCDACFQNIMTNIKHDAELIRSLDGPEKKYFCVKLDQDIISFDIIRNFRFDVSHAVNLKLESEQLDIKKQLKEEMENELEKRSLRGLEGLKPIEANCTTGDCAKYMFDFLIHTTDDDDEYVFDFTNANLAEWLPRLFHCKKSKPITASSYRDKLPSQDRKRQNHSKGRLKG